MKLLSLGLLAWFATSSTTASAVVGGPCSFEVYRPMYVERELRARLPELGIAALAPEFTVPGLRTGRVNLFRDHAVIGQMFYTQDARAGVSTLTVVDVHDRPLFRIAERTGLCPTHDPVGRCHSLHLFTELNQDYLVAVLDPNRSFVSYSRFGKPIGLADYRAEVAVALDWLQAVLKTANESVAPVGATPGERIFWALASDPVLAPYITRISVVPVRGRWHLRGVVPSNYVYGRAIDRARQAGFAGIVPDLVIDTRTALPPYLGPSLERCGL